MKHGTPLLPTSDDKKQFTANDCRPNPTQRPVTVTFPELIYRVTSLFEKLGTFYFYSQELGVDPTFWE